MLADISKAFNHRGSRHSVPMHMVCSPKTFPLELVDKVTRNRAVQRVTQLSRRR
jgi:hypothetical protein